VSTTGNVTAGNITSISSITRSGTLAQPSWTTNGIGLKLPAATYNETTAPGGTVAAQYIHNMGAPTLIASNATTYTNYATLFVAQPTPSTNVTVTNNYAIIASGNVSVSGNVVGGNLSVTGNITGNTAGYSIGYRDIPQVTFSANATAALADAGKHYYSTTAGNLSLTLPDNSTTAFPTGTSMTIVVQATGNVLVNAAAGVTLYLGGSSTSGNRVVGAYGMASVLKVAANVWFINGTGVY
jgi:hypothetical protein